VKLKVSQSSKIAGRGIAVFFEIEPDPQLQWCQHSVMIERPDGVSFKAIGTVEFARKVPPGEVQALCFSDLDESDMPAGSYITILGAIDGKQTNNA